MADMIVPASAAAGPGASSIVPYDEGQIGSDDIKPETPEDAETAGPDREWQFWDREIKSALKHENRWRVEARAAERIWFGPDEDPGRVADDEKDTANAITDKTALIHSNLAVLRPLIYSDTPQPIVRRRFFGDGRSKDETALMAAEAAQRIAQYHLDNSDFDLAMEGARDDWLIAGRGGARVHYRATTEMQPVPPELQMMGLPPEVPVKTDERIDVQHAAWERVLFAAAPWHSMPWVGFETPMTRTAVAKRFGPELAEAIRFDRAGIADKAIGDDDRDSAFASSDKAGDTETGSVEPSPYDTTMIWELWVRDTREVVWWCHGYPQRVLDKQPDPLNLEHFWPMPRPLVATAKSQSLTPRPDIRFYEQRAKEIDLASQKINVILDALSVSGLFPGTMAQEVQQLLAGQSKMIPVQSWQAFVETGGVGNMIAWLPLEPMIQAVNALLLMREQAKQAMFEASGVSDIMRAQGDPNETATAQQIKGRYAGLRLSERQRRMAIYARDTIRLMLEIAVEHFDVQTIAEISGLDLPMTEAEREQMIMQQQMAEQQHMQAMQMYQMAEQAIAQGMMQGPLPPAPPPPEKIHIPATSWELVHARLKDDFQRKITVSIETQSTVIADEQADKEARIEFLGAFATFVEQVVPLASSGVMDYKTIKELLLFGVRGFPKSRTLEGLIAALPDEPQGEPPPDTAITVANIRAETDKLLKEMDLADSEADRQHEVKLKGIELVQRGAEMGVEADPMPEPPQERRTN